MKPLSPRPHWLDTERVGEAVVVGFTAPALVDPPAVESLGRQLLALAGQARLLVVDCAGVQMMSSDMLCHLLRLHRAAGAAGNRLVLCGVGPMLGEVFDRLWLSAVLTVRADRAEALGAAAAGNACPDQDEETRP